MRKRLLTTLAVLAVLLAGGYLFLWWTAPPPHDNPLINAEIIKPGMTQAEVEAILGVPPDEHGDIDLMDGVVRKTWSSGEIVVYVQFDESGRVSQSAIFDRNQRRPQCREPAFARIRRWLGL